MAPRKPAKKPAPKKPVTVPKVAPINQKKPGTLSNLKNARKAADGLDKWRAQGGAPQSANQRTAQRTAAQRAAEQKAMKATPTQAPKLPKPPAAKPPAAKPSAAASTARAVGRGVAGGVGRVVNPALTLAAIADTARSVFNPTDNILTDLQKLGGVLGRNQNSGRTGAGRRENPASRRNGASNSSSNGSTARTAVGNIPAGEGTGRGSPNDPPRRASTSGGGSGGGGRSSGGGTPSRSSGPMPSSVMKASPASAPKPAEKKPSNSNVGPVADGEQYARNKDPKKYNPMMQRTFGYQKGDAPDQRAARDKTKGTGPVADGKEYASTIAPTKAESAKRRGGLTLEELRRRRTGR